MTLPLREQVRQAAHAAESEMDEPSLFSVVVEFDDDGQVVEAACGFRRDRRTWFGRPRLDVCQIRLTGSESTARVASSGTFHGAHYRRMAAIKESPMLEQELDLVALTLEPADARALIRRLASFEVGAAPGTPRHMALTTRGGRLVWQATLEVPAAGVHTVIVDAADGHIVFQKFDPFVAPAHAGANPSGAEP
jgi:hypothetical protein